MKRHTDTPTPTRKRIATVPPPPPLSLMAREKAERRVQLPPMGEGTFFSPMVEDVRAIIRRMTTHDECSKCGIVLPKVDMPFTANTGGAVLCMPCHRKTYAWNSHTGTDLTTLFRNTPLSTSAEVVACGSARGRYIYHQTLSSYIWDFVRFSKICECCETPLSQSDAMHDNGNLPLRFVCEKCIARCALCQCRKRIDRINHEYIRRAKGDDAWFFCDRCKNKLGMPAVNEYGQGFLSIACVHCSQPIACGSGGYIVNTVMRHGFAHSGCSTQNNK